MFPTCCPITYVTKAPAFYPARDTMSTASQRAGPRMTIPLHLKVSLSTSARVLHRDHLSGIRWKYGNGHRPHKLVHHVGNLIEELERAGAHMRPLRTFCAAQRGLLQARFGRLSIVGLALLW